MENRRVRVINALDTINSEKKQAIPVFVENIGDLAGSVTGAVNTVNFQEPDINGNVTVKAQHIEATDLNLNISTVQALLNSLQTQINNKGVSLLAQKKTYAPPVLAPTVFTKVDLKTNAIDLVNENTNMIYSTLNVNDIIVSQNGDLEVNIAFDLLRATGGNGIFSIKLVVDGVEYLSEKTVKDNGTIDSFHIQFLVPLPTATATPNVVNIEYKSNDGNIQIVEAKATTKLFTKGA